MLALTLAACTSSSPAPVPLTGRDWAAHPAVVEVDPPGALYALSDVHGGYDRVVKLLVTNGLLARTPTAAASAAWGGGDAVLVVIGDLFDKGPASLPVAELFRALEPRARAAGGRVIVTYGNHEAELLADPLNDKATADDGVSTELAAAGLVPAAFVRGDDPRAVWLRELPFAARAGRWFFAHAGHTHGRTIAELESALRRAAETNGFADAEITGESSLLEARGWYDGDEGIGARYAAAVGAEHVVFGHDPNALGPRGDIAVAQGGALLRVDCGMSPTIDDSRGKLLRVHRGATGEIAEELTASGEVKVLWEE